MRIIQVANVRWFNATSWYAMFLARMLQQAGHESLVLTLEGTESHQKAIDWGLNHKTLPLNSSNPVTIARLYKDLSDIVESFQPDVVNCHRGESFWLWAILRLLKRSFRLVRTRGDQRLPKGDPVNRWLHNSVADSVVVTNSVMFHHFRERFRTPYAKLHKIVGGVDRQKFSYDAEGRSRVRAEFGFTDDDFVFGMLGRFDEVKGQRELIQSISRLRRERGLSNARLMLLGFDSATKEDAVRQWIHEAHMDEAAVITGHRQDVAACISAMDAGVIASKWSETIARAALEIMSCGVPVVGSTVGVMPDLLAGEALFPVGDDNAMTETLAKCMNTPGFTQTIANTQSRRIKELSSEQFLAQTLKVYKGEQS